MTRLFWRHAFGEQRWLGGAAVSCRTKRKRMQKGNHSLLCLFQGLLNGTSHGRPSDQVATLSKRPHQREQSQRSKPVLIQSHAYSTWRPARQPPQVSPTQQRQRTRSTHTDGAVLNKIGNMPKCNTNLCKRGEAPERILSDLDVAHWISSLAIRGIMGRRGNYRVLWQTFFGGERLEESVCDQLWVEQP